MRAIAPAMPAVKGMPAAAPPTLAQRQATHAAALYVMATPLLWAAGLHVVVGALLVLRLLLQADARLAITPTAAVWLLVAAAQAVSVVVNGVGDDRTAGFIAYRLVSSGVTGWLMLGIALSLGAHYRMAAPALVRATCVLGGWFVLFGVLALILHGVTGLRELALPTPPAVFLPASAPAVQFSFTMHIFTSEDLLGRELPRLVLFYPWAVVLGFAGIAVFFIAQLERDPAFRVLGSAGGLLAVLGSQGRAPILALFILLGAQIAMLHFRRDAVLLLAAATLFLFALALPFGITPLDLVLGAYEGVNALRPGSSTARELGYALSMAGFLESPVLGKGWVGDHVAPGIPMPIGSHSSFYGVLYTGGAVTFALFIIALVTTLIAFARRARRGPVHRTGLLVMAGLALLSYGEGIYSFVLPCLPLLLVAGSALADDAQRPAAWRRT